MKKISTILIDMYGVILEESKGKFIPYTFKYFDSAEHERLKRQFKEEQLFTRAGLGEFTSDEFLSMLGYENPQYHMRDYIENYLTLDKGFVPFAEKYYKQYEFVLLSNDVSQWSSYITEYYQLNKYFSDKIVSGDVRCRKPEKRIYELTLDRMGRAPEECLFIDNSVKNLEVAAELGIQPVLFNRDNEEYGGTIVNSFAELECILEEFGSYA
ncbi:MAG: HAD-IA family hydrolase [Lachnospiraceae bacterium]|nr:HAD-IA family hydrolase [Lachnospiraceae bacterium]